MLNFLDNNLKIMNKIFHEVLYKNLLNLLTEIFKFWKKILTT